MPIERATIFLHGHTVEVDIGIHDFERAAPQRVIVDVEMDVSFDPDQATDDIATVLDYDFLRAGIAALAASRRFDLQETFCLAVLDLVRGRPAVRRAVVSTRKPDVYPDTDGVGFRLAWRRDE